MSRLMGLRSMDCYRVLANIVGDVMCNDKPPKYYAKKHHLNTLLQFYDYLELQPKSIFITECFLTRCRQGICAIAKRY